MTLKELCDSLPTMDDKGRADAVQKLSPMSHRSLLLFQANWDSNRSFEEFREEQNKVIRTCIELECSRIGTDVRRLENLEPLTLESEF